MRVERRPPLGQGGVDVALLGRLEPLALLAGPQCLEAAHHHEHGVVAAAVRQDVVEFAADLGELVGVVEIVGEGFVAADQLWDQGFCAVRPAGRQCRARRFEFGERRAQVGDRDRIAL